MVGHAAEWQGEAALPIYSSGTGAASEQRSAATCVANVYVHLISAGTSDVR